jgi:hypothetical protein
MGAGEPPWPSTAFSRTLAGQLTLARLLVAASSFLAIYLSKPAQPSSFFSFPFSVFAATT